MTGGDAGRVVVLGGGYAGVLAALRVKGRLGAAARVTLVNAAPHLVERVRLHEVAAGSPAPRHALGALTAGSGVEVCVGWVEGLDLPRRQAQVRTAEGACALPFDTLVYALGSGGPAAGVPGLREHAHTLGDETAALRLQAALAAQPAGAGVVVVGGGLTGVELASEVAERLPHLRVHLVSRGPVAPGLCAGAREEVAEVLEALGVTVHEDAAVERVEAEGVWLAGGERLAAGVTAWTGGFTPNPLARAAGLAVSAQGALLTDGALRSRSHPFVFGAGDGMAIDDDGAAHVRMACATALPLAAHAADNVARQLREEALQPFGFAFLLQCISLGRRRGLVQAVHGDDQPRDFFLRGAMAAWVKERVVRFAVGSLHAERRRPGALWWPGRSTPLVDWRQPRLAARGEA